MISLFLNYEYNVDSSTNSISHLTSRILSAACVGGDVFIQTNSFSFAKFLLVLKF
jgi:hypothetical protein